MPSVYGYIRVSSARQVRKGLSLEEQQGRIGRYAAEKNLGEPQWFVEKGISGKVPFADREAGAVLYARVRKGDHVVVTKLDRAFRNLFDFLDTFDRWVRAGVHIHIIDFGGNSIDPSSPTGRAIIQILAVVAQMERELIGQRVSEAHAFLREQGLYLNPIVPRGFTAVKNKKGRGYHAVADPYTYRLMMEIVDWRDVKGMTFDAIRWHLQKSKVKFPNQKYRCWSPDNVFRLYNEGLRLLAADRATKEAATAEIEV